VVGVDDPTRRSPEELAQILAKLGFSKFGHFWEPDERDIGAIEAEIEALKRHHIEPVVWWFSYSADDPFAKSLLETFKRHRIHPQLWLSPTYRDRELETKRLLPKHMSMPRSRKEIQELSPEDQKALGRASGQAYVNYMQNTFAATPEEQERRVEREASQLSELVKLVRPYGLEIALYNHGGWSGIIANQIAVLERLHERGVRGVGIAYSFNHARDRLHDDTKDFAAQWRQMQPYVVALSLHGTSWDDGVYPYLSQGDHELDMMRTIQDSGWTGPVALYAGKPGDTELTLVETLRGFDWVVAELHEPGSAGPRPFPSIKLSTSGRD